MTVKPLGDRVVIKNCEAEETTQSRAISWLLWNNLQNKRLYKGDETDGKEDCLRRRSPPQS